MSREYPVSAELPDPAGRFHTRRAILAGGAAGVGAGLLSTAGASADVLPVDERYVLRDRMPLNVKDPPFNAKGDGSTDDTAAIQAALNSGPPGASNTVFLPPGIYPITGLTIDSDTELFGAGWTSQLLVRSMADIYSLATAPGAHDVRLRDFSIDGNKANITGNSNDPPDPLAPFPAAAFIAQGNDSPCQRIYVDRLRVFNQKRLGIVFQTVQDGAVRDCLVEDNARDGITLYFDCTNIKITGNTVKRCADDSIGLNSEDGTSDVYAGGVGHLLDRIVVANNVLVGPGLGQGGVNKGRGMTVRGGRRITIAGNTIVDTSQGGIVLQDYRSTPLTDCVVSGNTIERPGYLGSNEKDGVRIETGSLTQPGVPTNFIGSTIQRVRVEGNLIRGALQIGVRLRNAKTSKADDDIRDIVIQGNVITDATNEGVGVSTGIGVNDVAIDHNLISGCGSGGIIIDAGALKRIHVRHNRVFRNTGYGIKLRLIADPVLVGNVVFEDRASGSGGTQTYGIHLFGLSGSGMIDGNRSYGNLTGQWEDAGSHSVALPSGSYRSVKATGTWDPPSTLNGAVATQVVALSGVTTNSIVQVSTGHNLSGSNQTIMAQATATDQVTITYRNNTGATQDLGSQSYRIRADVYLSGT